jgi:hypothetical protein
MPVISCGSLLAHFNLFFGDDGMALSSPWLLFFEKQPELHSESFGDMPQRHDCGIALTQFQAADVSAIDAHALGKLRLG